MPAAALSSLKVRMSASSFFLNGSAPRRLSGGRLPRRVLFRLSPIALTLQGLTVLLATSFQNSSPFSLHDLPLVDGVASHSLQALQ